jgi:monoamine oxidase
MTRKEFIKICGILGLGIPAQFSLSSFIQKDDHTLKFKGKVIIIGAGAGGLSAGYLLQQQGIDFEILEASANFGGRMKIDTNFTDFPIPLGAEWIETNPTIFQEIVNDSSTIVNIETVTDHPDRKFVNSSWYGFFEKYIVPSISSKIRFNTVVKSVDNTNDKIIMTTQNGAYTSDKVIVSVPLKILQDGDLLFTPKLPQYKIEAINNTTIWDGFKTFIEFSTKFYDDEHVVKINPKTKGEKIYYNAAQGQKTSKHILGLFVVGEAAQAFTSLSDIELKAFILKELDAIYDTQASPNYIKHIAQNWTKEPFIKGGYMTDHADWKTVRELGKPVANKLHFAGGAYTDGEDWVSIHAAARSARKAIEELCN